MISAVFVASDILSSKINPFGKRIPLRHEELRPVLRISSNCHLRALQRVT